MTSAGTAGTETAGAGTTAGPAGRDRFGTVTGGTYPGPGWADAGGRHIADRYRTAGNGRPGAAGALPAVGGRFPAGGPLPVGDGLWPGSGLPAGAGRWPGGESAPWPDLEPPGRSGGRWGGPGPWPALPDDRALWSVPEPDGVDAEHLRRLDREQAGG